MQRPKIVTYHVRHYGPHGGGISVTCTCQKSKSERNSEAYRFCDQTNSDAIPRLAKLHFGSFVSAAWSSFEVICGLSSSWSVAEADGHDGLFGFGFAGGVVEAEGDEAVVAGATEVEGAEG